MTRFLTVVAVAALGGAALAGNGAIGSASAGKVGAVSYLSTFDSSAEGWSAKPQEAGHSKWQASGGNPGGYLAAHISSGALGAAFGSGRSWAPANLRGDFGGTLKLDLLASPVDEAQVVIVSNNSSLAACHHFDSLAAAWATYSVNLDLTDLRECRTDTALSPAQVSAVLAGFVSISVSVVNGDIGAYDVGLDNASLSGPESAVTAPAGPVARRLFIEYGRKTRIVSGTLSAPEDYSCAGRTSVTIFRRAKTPVKVATATTATTAPAAAHGVRSYSVKLKAIRTGSYYAMIRAGKSRLDGNTCTGARSRSIKIRG